MVAPGPYLLRGMADYLWCLHISQGTHAWHPHILRVCLVAPYPVTSKHGHQSHTRYWVQASMQLGSVHLTRAAAQDWLPSAPETSGGCMRGAGQRQM
jgi:hypothetical protein